jgi:hypothetical protein
MRILLEGKFGLICVVEYFWLLKQLLWIPESLYATTLSTIFFLFKAESVFR